MQCRSVLTRVDALRTGELPAKEQQEIDRHLKSCPSCNESLDDVDNLARCVTALRPAPPQSCRPALADSYDLLADGDGPLWIAFTPKGIRLILRGGTEEEFRSAYCRRYGRLLERAAMPAALQAQVTAALGGEGVDRPRTDWDAELSPLERDVFAALTRIPRGEVRTYEWLARKAGHPRAVRAVGSVLARNRVPIVVPCHRVVPAAGGVGQYIFGSSMKRELLRREGVDIDALDALAGRGVRFIGSKTTNIACFPTCRDARRIREENRVPFHDAGEAEKRGFRPCMKCQPWAA